MFVSDRILSLKLRFTPQLGSQSEKQNENEEKIRAIDIALALFLTLIFVPLVGQISNQKLVEDIQDLLKRD